MVMKNNHSQVSLEMNDSGTNEDFLANNNNNNDDNNNNQRLGMSQAYHSHTHPLSDASRLARDRFESGQWRFEDRPKPLSRQQGEDVRKIGWVLVDERESGESQNRRAQKREDQDYEKRTRVTKEDIDVQVNGDSEFNGETGDDSTNSEDDDSNKNECEAKTPCGVAFESKTKCVDLCESATFEPIEMPRASDEEKKDAFYLKTHFDYFQRRRESCPKNGVDHTAVIYHAPERVSVGKHLANVASGLARASAFNKTYIPGRLSMRQWTSAKRCGLNRNVMCYLKPFCKCLLDVRDKEGRQIGASMAGTAMFGANGLMDFSVYKTKRRGTLMYQAEALSYVFDPNRRAQAVIRAAFRDSIHHAVEKNSNFEMPERDSGHPFGKCVAVHVRRSGCIRDIDSHENPDRKEGLCVSPKKYIEKANDFARKYNLQSIVLITDDLKVTAQCSSNTEFPCFYTTSTIRLLHDVENDVNENLPTFRKLLWKDSGKDRAVSAALATVIELEAARTCDAFVGQFSSGFSRMAYMLVSARMATPAPYRSLDDVPFHLE